MRAPRSLAVPVAVVVLALGGLTACGGSDDSGGSSDPGTAPESASPEQPEGGSGDAEGAEGGSGTSVSFGDCSAITAEEMGAVLGEGTGIAEVPPGGGLCNYRLDDPVQPSVTIEQFTTADFADGFDGAKDNIANTAIGPIEGTPQPVGAGDDAELVVGPSTGGNLQSIGLVLLGDTIVRASVLQAVDLDEAAMVSLTTDILTLVASKA